MSALFDLAFQHHTAGRLAEAETLYREILRSEPQHAEALHGLGFIAWQVGDHAAATELIGAAILMQPATAHYHNNLGLPLQALGRLAEASASYRRALVLNPGYAQAHYNLGNVLKGQGRLGDAAASYRSALAANAGFPEALCNLGSVLRSLGDHNEALACYVRALAVSELPEAKQGFVACVRNIRFSADNALVRDLVVRALTEPWGRPSDLAAVSIGLVQCDAQIHAAIARANAAWPARVEGEALFGAAGAAAAGDHALLLALLQSTPVCDLELERFLTGYRYAMLRMAEKGGDTADTLLGFYCAIAQQCFINEYCFDCTAEEEARAGALRDGLLRAIAAGEPVPPLRVTALAAYFPLHALPSALKLLELKWPSAVTRLLTMQVSEPYEERQLRASIAQLTAVDAAAPGSVRAQYEENPFPRWMRLPAAAGAESLDARLRRLFPAAPLQPLADPREILVAGCGSGLHSIEIARQFPRARVLAIDLSLASLAYAERKTRELGLTNIEYAQADIMRLGNTGHRFDVVESAGVLHHLADPLAGWRVLVSLLRPGGLMRLGLYSERARHTVVAARDFIAERGFEPTPQDIRRCRQELVAAGGEFSPLLAAADFYSMSECRDLLFNVQEHRFTLPQIDAALAGLGLAFLGFDIAPAVLAVYRELFPDDNAMTDLKNWDRFEAEYPDTFAGMFQFWVQKPH
jgi:tetratricopeptide (TPR) repeat protein/2-polyprenyl-3-methyl-5-hydroxy-6-metoxy-1,4-benzoquinol methylase